MIKKKNKEYQKAAREFGLTHGGYVWVDHHYGWDWYLCSRCYHIFKTFLEVNMDHDRMRCPFCVAYAEYAEMVRFAEKMGGRCITTLSEYMEHMDRPDRDCYGDTPWVTFQCAEEHIFKLFCTSLGTRWCPECNDYSMLDRLDGAILSWLFGGPARPAYQIFTGSDTTEVFEDE